MHSHTGIGKPTNLCFYRYKVIYSLYTSVESRKSEREREREREEEKERERERERVREKERERERERERILDTIIKSAKSMTIIDV